MQEESAQDCDHELDVKVMKNLWLEPLTSCFATVMSAFAGPDFAEDLDEPAWEIPAADIHGKKFLGAGGQGVVYTGLWNGDVVAVKLVREKYETICAQELRRLNHTNIIRFLGVCSNPPVYGIVMELAQYGSLFHFLSSGSNLFPGQLIKWAKDVAAGMAYLNENRIIHRDLKSPNVLIADNYVAKVSDFGTSREWQDVSTVMTFRGTIAWMAPEVIRNQLCSDRIDVWSYGVLLWEIITREIPYRPFEPHMILFAVGGDKISLPIPGGCPYTMQVLIAQCWQKVPKDRPSFKEIVADLQLVAEEFEAIDPGTFANDQIAWGDEVRTAMDNMFVIRSAEATQESNDTSEDTETLRQSLRQARDMYIKHTTNANEMFMDVCATQLQLEQRERDIAEREKNLLSCRCGLRKPIRRQESTTSSDPMPKKNPMPVTKQPIKKQPIKKQARVQPLIKTQMVTNYIDNKQGLTYTVAIDSCPCTKQNVFNNNLVNQSNKDTDQCEAQGTSPPTVDEAAQPPIDATVQPESIGSDLPAAEAAEVHYKDTVLEENGNQVKCVPLEKRHLLDNVQHVAQI